MINGEFIKYIDTKGKEHNAQVVSFRPDPAQPKFPDPLVTLSYVPPGRAAAITVVDVVHHLHPSKDEPNPNLPRIVLHAWKHMDEVHVAPAQDHPVFDHPHERPKMDEFGQPIAKARPANEAMVQAHIENTPFDLSPFQDDVFYGPHACEVCSGMIVRQQLEKGGKKFASLGLPPEFYPNNRPDLPWKLHECTGSEKSIGTGQVAPVSVEHNPGNPTTIHFGSLCGKCGTQVRRVAHHQGAQEFDVDPIKDDQGNEKWVRHACKQDVLRNNANSALKGQRPHQSWCSIHAGSDCDCRPTRTVTTIPASGVQAAAEPLPNEPGVIAQLEEDVKKTPPQPEQPSDGA